MGDEDFSYNTFVKINNATGLPLIKTYSTVADSPFETKIEPIELNRIKDSLFYHKWITTESNGKPPHIIGTPREILDGDCVVKLDYEQLLELMSFKQKSLLVFVSGDIGVEQVSSLTKLGKLFPIYILDENNTLDNTIEYVLKES